MNEKQHMHPYVYCSVIKVPKIWKQPKCPPADEWIKMLWYIYTLEYHAAVKKEEVLPFATAWLDLENIMLSEIRQSAEDKYRILSLICGI